MILLDNFRDLHDFQYVGMSFQRDAVVDLINIPDRCKYLKNKMSYGSAVKTIIS